MLLPPPLSSLPPVLPTLSLVPLRLRHCTVVALAWVSSSPAARAGSGKGGLADSCLCGGAQGQGLCLPSLSPSISTPPSMPAARVPPHCPWLFPVPCCLRLLLSLVSAVSGSCCPGPHASKFPLSMSTALAVGGPAHSIGHLSAPGPPATWSSAGPAALGTTALRTSGSLPPMWTHRGRVPRRLPVLYDRGQLLNAVTAGSSAQTGLWLQVLALLTSAGNLNWVGTTRSHCARCPKPLQPTWTNPHVQASPHLSAVPRTALTGLASCVVSASPSCTTRLILNPRRHCLHHLWVGERLELLCWGF